jgi:hypothetical protein
MREDEGGRERTREGERGLCVRLLLHPVDAVDVLEVGHREREALERHVGEQLGAEQAELHPRELT